MREAKTTTFWLTKKNLKKNPSEGDLLIFQQLKKLLQPYEDRLEIRVPNPHHYELWTKDWVRLSARDHRPNNKKFQFAAIGIYDKKVSLHFHPMFIDRSIKDKLKVELKIVVAGVAVLHFKNTIDDKVAAELRDLFEIGWECYKKLKFVRSERVLY
jgi:hypothetical protein